MIGAAFLSLCLFSPTCLNRRCCQLLIKCCLLPSRVLVASPAYVWVSTLVCGAEPGLSQSTWGDLAASTCSAAPVLTARPMSLGTAAGFITSQLRESLRVSYPGSYSLAFSLNAVKSPLFPNSVQKIQTQMTRELVSSAKGSLIYCDTEKG